MPERTTRSLCPVCKKQISAEIKKEGFNVYLHKNCPEHGKFRVLISKDAARFSDKTFSSPGKPFKARSKPGQTRAARIIAAGAARISSISAPG